MKQKILVLIETPFQLLCAFEYMCQHEADYQVCLRKSRVGINDQQLDAMVVELGLKVACVFDVKAGDRWAYAKALVGFMPFCLKKYDKVVIGSYFSGLLRFFSKIVVKEEVILLDDGVATLLIDKMFKEKGEQYYSVFSIFPLEKNTYRHYQYNDFKSLIKQYACTATQGYTAFFIGQKLVDMGAIGMEDYIRLLEWAVKDAEGQIVHYVPHRAESNECIARIKAVKGIEILPSDVAIEYFLLRNKWYPHKIYSVISTALFTLASIYPDADVVAIQPKSLKTQLFVHYDMIIEALQRHSSAIKLIDIE